MIIIFFKVFLDGSILSEITADSRLAKLSGLGPSPYLSFRPFDSLFASPSGLLTLTGGFVESLVHPIIER